LTSSPSKLKTLANLSRRLDALEAQQAREELPSILVADRPIERKLRPEIEAKLADQTIIVLPIGRSALRDAEGEADPQIEYSRKFFVESK
jgi:hypothetical protein